MKTIRIFPQIIPHAIPNSMIGISFRDVIIYIWPENANTIQEQLIIDSSFLEALNMKHNLQYATELTVLFANLCDIVALKRFLYYLPLVRDIHHWRLVSLKKG